MEVVRNFKVTLRGRMPLIQHHDNIAWADTIAEERTRIKAQDPKNFSAGDDRCPPSTWKGCLYTNGKTVVIPTDNLAAGLKRAGAQISLKGKKTFKAATQSGILFGQTEWPLFVSGREVAVDDVNAIDGPFAKQVQDVTKLGFSLLVKRAVIGQAKHVRVRPMFRDWSTEGVITVNEEQLEDAIVANLFAIFGRFIGLCDWRPGSRQPGPYGTFDAAVSRVS